jgi:hypothetical protein
VASAEIDPELSGVSQVADNLVVKLNGTIISQAAGAFLATDPSLFLVGEDILLFEVTNGPGFTWVQVSANVVASLPSVLAVNPNSALFH